MSRLNREVTLATRILCDSTGSMQLLQLHRKLLQRCGITEEDLRYMVRECSRFLLVPGSADHGLDRLQDYIVVAKTSLRLCRRYLSEQCAGCEDLHLCRYYVYGNCKFGKGRKPCKFSHDICSDHNYPLLRECTLHELKEDELFLLLLQNDPALLPEVCLHYNKGSGPHGSCTFKENCTKVHMCLHFIQGLCVFGPKCKKLHTVDEHGRRMLQERGLSSDIINDLPVIYQNIHHLTSAVAEDIPDSAGECLDEPDSFEDICLHFIRNSCRFQENCHLVHFHLPYKWQVHDGDTWLDLLYMEDIEQAFCDPSKTQSSGPQLVDFLSMTMESQPVRRLSTVSSVKRPPHYTMTTEWLWYYKAEHGKWVEFGQLDDKLRTTSVSSRSLEEAFLSNREAEVPVVKGQRQYIISFKDMYQRNPKHNTKRKIRRRPRFMSPSEVERQAAQ
ncbi:protein mono-ADP-ribosyltransferase PARP12b [Sphaeramia orbicularis]|uniref:Protein mono-ADP-ribosyltransferase PARP12-like n=1 Tax=Sphaeramia orbicularis TaxID=375764 RepID=A0A672YTJ4_9TELE|nr:protein mono-ADP-ribosyltransferase PARP12-like [Sphaeramia orbicularis]